MKIRLTKIQEKRRLTIWSWLIILVLLSVAVYVWAISVYDFLAQNKTVDARILVIEGYIPDNAIDSLIPIFNDVSYDLVVCAGTPIAKGSICLEYDNYADYNADFLVKKGVDSSRVVSAPSYYIPKNRTFTTAVAVEEKLKELGYSSGNINLLCYGTHGRRSRLLYGKALDSSRNIGVISIAEELYDPQKWWYSSEGARGVVYEMLAYFYCLLFFHP